ncbi:MAG: S46 family peptidase [Ignavibacteriaceae bacterium]|nr:S46 family peptidase [Ignavibacteriaceae bacterium]
MKKLLLLLSILFYQTGILTAQEGMWLLNQINMFDLKEYGFQISADDIYDPEKPSLFNAIIQLGGGTASFVSPEGLILTNHHVAYTALQRASTSENNYLANGFLANNKSEEIQAPGYVARILLKMKDVTNDIHSYLKDAKDPMDRQTKLQEKIKAITDEAKGNLTDIQANVSEMYNGREYYLFVYKTFKDVRLVYAPPESIGKFGGEIDNWMWPRHTGDFSFLRIYAAPNGEGREYNTDNIPYKPKVWLKLSNSDLDEGDITFILGFPGFTTRYRSSNSVRWNLYENYPFTIKNFREIIDLMDELTKNSEEGQLKVAAFKSGLANTLKNSEGKVEGMIKINYLQKKLDFEKKFLDWLAENPDLKAKYGSVFSDEKKLYDELQKNKQKDNVLGILGGLAGTPLSLAIQIYNSAKEFDKPESERQSGFTPEALENFKRQVSFQYANYFMPVDKALMVRGLKMASMLPEGQKLNGISNLMIGGKTPEEIVEEFWKTSKLTDPEYAKSLIGLSVKELEALNDPFIKLAAALSEDFDDSQNRGQNFNVSVTQIRKLYIDALYEWKGSKLYPDANGTMRFTFGPVRGYNPADAVWYYPFTTLRGVIEKEKNQDPFDVPDKLVDLYENKNWEGYVDPDLEQVPVAFTHMCDITGGNSGSPVMNGKGELIGLAFDGNYEAMISDWQYDAELQRTISVDVRYILFVTEKFGNAGYLLKEMGAVK